MIPAPAADRSSVAGGDGGGYDEAYYRSLAAGSDPSAQVIVPWVNAHVRPASVVDVGCGAGSWLRAFMDAGVEDVLGLDGDWVPEAELRIPRERFRTTDLRAPGEVARRFDLAISLEVAEHLPAGAADELVATLVGLAPVALFSAAVPGQSGVDHINEQWPAYWAQRFAQHGYDAFDVVRSRFWRDPSVKWWYPQNTLLYAERGSEPAERIGAELGPALNEPPLALVHPGMVAAMDEQHAAELEPRPSLRRAVEGIWPAVGRRGRSLLGR
jgi:SAM-dependent methyltransferase